MSRARRKSVNLTPNPTTDDNLANTEGTSLNTVEHHATTDADRGEGDASPGDPTDRSKNLNPLDEKGASDG